MDKTMRFNSTLTNVQQINPLFSKATSRVLYTGLNRNNSYISKETVEKALYSIKNIPVVGEYLSAKDNFGGHGGKLEISDKGIEWINTTVPFGVVSSDANIYWENVTEVDGTVNEYLVVDGIYLWTGRYSELNVLLEQGKLNQSMEIDIVNGSFAVVDGIETFKIDDMIFSALCMLGVDKGDNPDDHVEPCFESADIQLSYNLNKDKFKQEFNQMLAELKFSMQQEGGNNVTEETVQVTETDVEITEESAQEETTEQEFEVTETTEELETSEVESTEVTEEFEVATVTEEVTKTEVETTVTTIETEGDTTVADLVGNDKELRDVEVVDYEAFALTHGQLKEQLRMELGKEKYIDSWGDQCRKYWYVDSTSTHVIFEHAQEGYQLYQSIYTLNGDNVVIDFTTSEKVKIEYVPFVEGVAQPTFERIESINSELEELKTFKRHVEEQELASKFEGQLTEDELKEVFTNSKDSKLEDIEKELFALVGKKNFSLSQEKESVKVQIVNNKEESKINNPYKNFFE